MSLAWASRERPRARCPGRQETSSTFCGCGAAHRRWPRKTCAAPSPRARNDRASRGDAMSSLGERSMLLVVHTGRPEGVQTAREVSDRLCAAGVTVRVLETEAQDL